MSGIRTVTGKRKKNDGVRKICDCARKRWSECAHSWYLNFQWKGKQYRFSLDRELNRRIASKTEADGEAERLKTAIRDGKFRAGAPALESLTLTKLFAEYDRRYLQIHRKATAANTKSQTNVITRTVLPHPTKGDQPFGQWLVSDITTDTIEQYREIRRATAPIAANRDLALLRAMFAWGASKKRRHVADNPFRDGDQAAVRGISQKTERSRRLEAGEADRLLDACGTHLRALVEAALETGCRKGELLSLQWHQVRAHELFLPAQKTKTKQARTVPISGRLRSILDMRRHGPDGEEHASDAYVFGTETGERLTTPKRAWERAVLVAHGHKAEYVMRPAKVEGQKPVRTAVLTPESRARLRAIGLHFHDLRREAGSRWQDAGVPLQTIRGLAGAREHQPDVHVPCQHSSGFAGCDAGIRARQAIARNCKRSRKWRDSTALNGRDGGRTAAKYRHNPALAVMQVRLGVRGSLVRIQSSRPIKMGLFEKSSRPIFLIGHL